MSYLNFVLGNWRLLGFGFLLSFGSSFGQTFYVSLFGAELRAALDITHGEFGLFYSAATVASAASLAWIGQRIDDIDLRLYSALACVFLALSCVLIAVSTTGWIFLIALFGLRLAGQGAMPHTAMTTMARYFDAGRGRAISIAVLGLPTGEAFLPFLSVTAAAAIGWRTTWWIAAAFLVVGFLPLMLWFLRGHGERRAEMLRRTEAGAGAGGQRQWTRGEVLRDPRFYCLMPAMIAPAALLTGTFFHQAHVAAAKGWSLEWLAACFFLFAGLRIVVGLLFGGLVDRYSAFRLVRWLMLPLIAGFLALALIDDPVGAVFYMGLSGIGVGAFFAIVGALWAELYGVRHIGAIRAVISSFMVFSTALAPFGFGALFDVGVSVEAVAAGCAVYCVASTLLLFTVARNGRRPA